MLYVDNIYSPSSLLVTNETQPYSKGYNMYISYPKLLNPENTQDPFIYSDTDFHVVGLPNSQGGLFCNSQALYYLNLTSFQYVRIMDLPVGSQVTYLTLSTDGSIAFIATGSVLRMINISNLTSPTLLIDLIYGDRVYSITMSNDTKILYMLRNDLNQQLAYLDILNTSLLTNPTLIRSIVMHDIIVSEKKMVLMSNDSILLIPSSPSMFVADVSDPQNTIILQSNIPALNYGIAASSDGTTAYILSNDKFVTVNFFCNIELKHQLISTFNFSEAMSTYTIDKYNYVTASADGETVYLFSDQTIDTYQASDQGLLTYQDSIPINMTQIAYVSFSPNNQAVCIMNSNNDILVVDINNKSVLLPEASLLNDGYLDYSNYFICEFLPNENTVLFSQYIKQDNAYYLKALNLLNSTSLEDSQSFFHDGSMVTPYFVTDGEVLYVSGDYKYHQYAYNISGMFNQNNEGESIYARQISRSTSDFVTINDLIVLSADNKTLFMLGSDGNTGNSFAIFNVSDPARITLISSVTIRDSAMRRRAMTISPDENTAVLLMSWNKLLLVDISDKTSPIIAGLITVDSSLMAEPITRSYCQYSIAILPHSKSILINNDQYGLRVITGPQYAATLDPDTIRLGEMSTHSLIVMQKNSIGRYNLLSENYKLLRMQLYNITVSPLSYDQTIIYEPLPSWITLDSSRTVLYIDPTTQTAFGHSRIYAVISIQISLLDLLLHVNMMPDLISFGYLDIEGYITAGFDITKPLILPFQYGPSDIDFASKLLRNHYIETIIPIYVASSLSLNLSFGLSSISTSSQYPLIVTIILSSVKTSPRHCQFIKNINLPVVSTIQGNTTTLEGGLTEINKALNQIVVNLDDDMPACDGRIIINDGLNPALDENYPELSNCLHTNNAPEFNPDAFTQRQLDGLSISTGSFFSVLLNETTFKDANLKYSLITDTPLPWLTLSGLFLSGTPPVDIWPPQQAQFWKRTYDFKLVASNEFKSTSISFTLDVYLSIFDALKLIAQVFTIIGLWVYFPTILNVLSRSFYNYPKQFSLQVDQEITSLHVFPIAFIKTELAESRMLMKELQKYVAKDLERRSVTRVELIEYLMDSQKQNIDKDKLAETTKKVAFSLLDKNKIQFQQVDPKKEMIDQLIMNKLVLWQIDLKHENETKKAFEILKSKWIDLAQKDLDLSWQFSVNQTQLEKELRSITIDLKSASQSTNNQQSSITEHSIQLSCLNISEQEKKSDNDSNASIKDASSKTTALDTGLLSEDRKKKASKKEKYKLNIALLNNALVAHIFRKQHLNIRADEVHIQMLEKTKASSFKLVRMVKRFIKLDLKPMYLNNISSVGYGLEYEIRNSVLIFFGAPRISIENKIMVLQIKNRRSRIIRELWFNNRANKHDETDLVGKEEQEIQNLIL